MAKKAAPKKGKKSVRTKIVTGKHALSNAEKLAVAEELSDSLQRKKVREDELKLHNAEAKALISADNEKIKVFAQKLQTGEEDRDYECTISKDYDKQEKTYTDVKTGKVVSVLPFTALDYQRDLDELEEEAAQEKAKEEKAAKKKVAPVKKVKEPKAPKQPKEPKVKKEPKAKKDTQKKE